MLAHQETQSEMGCPTNLSICRRYQMYFIQEDDPFFNEMKEWMKNNPLEKPTEIFHKVVAWNKGKKLSEEHKKAMSETHKKLPRSGNARKGIIFSEEHKKKLSESAKRRKKTVLSDEHKQKLSEIALKRKPIYDTCPHCGWHGLKRVVYRHHFSKCKNKSNLP